MFGPCLIPKHHKHKTPDAETGENRSFPRQLLRGMKHILRWCEKTSAEQPTIYTRYTAMTQVVHRSRKKISQGSIRPYNTPNNCKPERDSQQKFTFHICSNHLLISNITSLKRQMQRQERTGQFHVNSKKEWNNAFDGVNHRVQSNRQLHKTYGNDTSLPSKQKKNLKEALDRATRQIPVNRKENPNKNSPFIHLRTMC